MNTRIHRRIRTGLSLTLLLSCALLLFACAGSNNRQDPLGVMTGVQAPQSQAWAKLLKGDTTPALDAFQADPGASTAINLYGQGEAAFFVGKYNEALDSYVKAVQAQPHDPVAGWALSRIHELAYLADDTEKHAKLATEAVFQAIKDPRPVPAWNRLQAQTLDLWWSRQQWKRSENVEPFNGNPWGVPGSWRVVGPSSLHSNLDFLETPEPEKDPEFKDTYIFRGFETHTETLHKPTKSFDIKGNLTGLYVAETWLELSKEALLDLSLESEGLALVKIDGQEVWRRDDQKSYSATQSWVEGIKLAPGVHRVTMRMGYVRNYKVQMGMVFLPRNSDTKLKFSATRPEKASKGALLAKGKARSWVGEGINSKAFTKEPLLLLLAAQRAVEVQDEFKAFALLEALSNAAPDYIGYHLLNASYWGSRWGVPYGIRERERLESLRHAMTVHPDNQHVALLLARVFRQQKSKSDARDMIEILTREPITQGAVWSELARYYGWRGLPEKQEHALDQALTLDTSDCEVLQRLYILWRRRDYTPSRAAMPNGWQACEDVDWLYARDVELTQGIPARYMMLLRRDTTRYPHNPAMWIRWVKALRQSGTKIVVDDGLEQALSYHPRNPQLLRIKADVLLERDQPQEALKVLQEGLKHYPASEALLKRVALLGGKLPLEEMRVDASQAIKDYESQDFQPNASAVYVLDYMVQHYAEDGSRVDLTQLIVQVRSKEGIDAYGEVSFPNGSLPLMAHTIKKDGRIIEPQMQQGKSTLSMEGLEPGDYIEYAYLDFRGFNPTRKGATSGSRFYFAMEKIASARSELILQYPEDWKPLVERLHGGPIPEITTDKGMTQARYVRTNSAQPRAESRSVDDGEYLPQVDILHRYTWADTHRYFQNNLAGALTTSPKLHKYTENLIAEAKAKTPREKVETLFDYVKGEVRKPSFRDFSTDASHVLATSQGNPLVLLQAMLRIADIDSEMILAKPKGKDPVETEIPSFEDYSFTLLRVKLKDGDLWLRPSSSYDVINVLPYYVQGQPAISIEPDASLERITIPFTDTNLKTRVVDLNLTLDKEGTLSGEVVETIKGWRARNRRLSYAGDLYAKEQLQRFVEERLNYDISGGEVISWEILGKEEEEADKPLILKMKFKRPGYARVEGKTLIIEDRYDLPDITRRYARLPERTRAMLMVRHDQEVTYSLTGPEGMAISFPGAPEVTLESPFGTYSRSVETQANTMRMRHRLLIPVQRIPKEAYQDFANWASDVDRATYVRIELE